jgi:hypothetical protein
LGQSIIIGLYKTETLLKYAPADIKRYLHPFLDQLNKLKELPSEHLIDENGGKSIINLMDICLASLTKNDIDTDELFAQLLCFTIKSVLLVKNHEKIRQSSAEGFNAYSYRNN